MSIITQEDLIARNQRRSVGVIIIFIAFITFLGYLAYRAELISLDGLLLLSTISLCWSLFSYFLSPAAILSFAHAKRASKKQYYDYYTVVENLCLGANLPMPKLYVIEDEALNAFATGLSPKSGVICATSALLKKLSRYELEAVMAHELSHIKHYDIRLASLIAVLAGSVLMVIEIIYRRNWFGRRSTRDNDNNGILVAIFYLLAFVAPLILSLLQLALSRQREYLADAGSVQMTHNPQALIRALEKISVDPKPLTHISASFSQLCICDPFKKKDFIQAVAEFFATHPSVEQRIAILKKIS